MDTLTDTPAPAADTAEVTFIQPSTEDAKPRVEKGRPEPTDPDAPYGWMVDPVTGERRAKKAPGRQRKNTDKSPVSPPANRRANKPRTITATPDKSTTEPNYAHKAGALVDSLWFLAAGLPSADVKVFGRSLKPHLTKARATAALLDEERPRIVQLGAIMAQHSSFVRRGLDSFDAENGPGWVMPAVMMAAPLALAVAAVWRSNEEDVAALADSASEKFRSLVTSAQQAAEAAAADALSQAGPVAPAPVGV